MKIIILTNEYPPHIYGGAGIHVTNLTKELAGLDGGAHNIQILCFGEQKEYSKNIKVQGIQIDFSFPYHDTCNKKLLETLFRNIFMTGAVSKADIVHCHTWYTLLAGCLIKRILNIPFVITAHSLEPQRPWKEEQLGSAYKASIWVEKTALENADGIIAVSQFMKKSIQDIYNISHEKIRIIPNGIDINQYKPTFNQEMLRLCKINPDKPFVLFVGRITRQKGIFHLLNAIKYLVPNMQIVLLAADPDTKEILNEMKEQVRKVEAKTSNRIIWIDKFIPREHLITLYSHASVFVCPSIYEPFGIINLEAMACGTPVVASAVGGILEVVIHNETGFLVSFEPLDTNNPEPYNPEQFARDLATAINELILSPEKTQMMGTKARETVVRHYSWQSIATQTLEFYEELIKKKI
jgi:alpha-maltose-1-phosphate synthase